MGQIANSNGKSETWLVFWVHGWGGIGFGLDPVPVDDELLESVRKRY